MFYSRKKSSLFQYILNDLKKYNPCFPFAFDTSIVVAIIAVLVAISIPVFTTILEKSREAKDLAMVRSAYAEIMNAAISEQTDVDFDSEGNITKIWTNTVSASNPVSFGRNGTNGFTAYWDNPSKYDLVYDATASN